MLNSVESFSGFFDFLGYIGNPSHVCLFKFFKNTTFCDWFLIRCIEVKIPNTLLKILIKNEENKKLTFNRYKMKHLRHLNNARTIKLNDSKVEHIVRFKKWNIIVTTNSDTCEKKNTVPLVIIILFSLVLYSMASRTIQCPLLGDHSFRVAYH